MALSMVVLVSMLWQASSAVDLRQSESQCKELQRRVAVLEERLRDQEDEFSHRLAKATVSSMSTGQVRAFLHAHL